LLHILTAGNQKGLSQKGKAYIANSMWMGNSDP